MPQDEANSLSLLRWFNAAFDEMFAAQFATPQKVQWLPWAAHTLLFSKVWP